MGCRRGTKGTFLRMLLYSIRRAGLDSLRNSISSAIAILFSSCTKRMKMDFNSSEGIKLMASKKLIKLTLRFRLLWSLILLKLSL